MQLFHMQASSTELGHFQRGIDCLLLTQELSKRFNSISHRVFQKIVKHDLVFAFKNKKVCTRIKNKGEQLQKRSFAKNKKEAEDMHTDFHLELLNDHKAYIFHALISVLDRDQWISRFNIKCKMAQCLDFNRYEC